MNQQEIDIHLQKLTPAQEAFVWGRVEYPLMGIESLMKKVGITRYQLYDQTDKETRDFLEELAREIRRNGQWRTLRKINEVLPEAFETVYKLMQGAKSDYVKLQAAVKLLEYGLGTPTQRVDVTSAGESVKMYVGVSPDDWDDD